MLCASTYLLLGQQEIIFFMLSSQRGTDPCCFVAHLVWQKAVILFRFYSYILAWRTRYCIVWQSSRLGIRRGSAHKNSLLLPVFGFISRLVSLLLAKKNYSASSSCHTIEHDQPFIYFFYTFFPLINHWYCYRISDLYCVWTTLVLVQTKIGSCPSGYDFLQIFLCLLARCHHRFACFVSWSDWKHLFKGHNHKS